jgi:hypothetical protein
MSYTKTIPFLLAPLLLAVCALAQTRDWQAVKNLQPGTRISVRSDHLFIRNTCFFLSATDDQLVCERAVHGRRRISFRLFHRRPSTSAAGYAKYASSMARPPT